MKTFYVVSFSVMVATLVAVLAKSPPPPEPQTADPEKFTGVAYKEIKIGDSLSGSFVYREGMGLDFRAYAFGREQARIAHDKSQYWLWMSGYDPRRYHFFLGSEPFLPRLAPPFRPSFCRWVLNRENESSTFLDGEYTVEIRVEDGCVRYQSYTREGVVEVEVFVLAFQSSRGIKFPALASIKSADHGVVEIEMGVAEVNPDEEPDLSPPTGMRGVELPL